MNRIKTKTKVIFAAAKEDMPWQNVLKGDIIIAVKQDERVKHSAYVWHYLNVRTAACFALTASQIRCDCWTILREISADEAAGSIFWQQVF